MKSIKNSLIVFVMATAVDCCLGAEVEHGMLGMEGMQGMQKGQGQHGNMDQMMRSRNRHSDSASLFRHSRRQSHSVARQRVDSTPGRNRRPNPSSRSISYLGLGSTEVLRVPF
jgi:hypothetical protein